jgi:hypothetical protein
MAQKSEILRFLRHKYNAKGTVTHPAFTAFYPAFTAEPFWGSIFCDTIQARP